MRNQIHNVDYLKERRRILRKHMTLAEVCLWRLLKNQQTGKRFRRQHSIENYIVDFYCPSECLVIELDGSIHNDLCQAYADEIRDRRLKVLGFKVLRFDNDMVLNYSDWVIECIKNEFKG